MRDRSLRPQDMMRPADAGAVLKVHPRTVIRWAQAGKLTDEPTDSGRHRFLRDEVLALARKIRAVNDQEISKMLRQHLGRRRYWFWTMAAEILPARALCWLLRRVPGERREEVRWMNTHCSRRL